MGLRGLRPGTKANFLEEGLFIPVSENRYGLDGIEERGVPMYAKAKDLSTVPFFIPNKAL